MGTASERRKGACVQEQATLPVETVIRGQYIIEGLLGRSSSGATYLVRNQHTRDAQGKLFVLKEVVEPNKQARHRLASDGRLLRRLHHLGLPSIHRVFKDNKNNRMYLLMEYIAGQDLDTLRQHQPQKLFSWNEVLHIMSPIIAAVTYLHHQQPPVIHGDIKPANIIMAKEDIRSVLVDFGMLKAGDPGSTTATGRYCYRAPEQYDGSVDVRTDIYALGATFYTLVTGRLPPDALSRLTQVGNGAMDPLEPVNSVVPALPMTIGKAIERAMSLNAQRRFSSVEQFWEALWLLPILHPAPVFDIPVVPKGPSTDPRSGTAVGQAIEKPMPEPSPVVPASVEEQEDLDAELPPPLVPMLDSVEVQEDLDTEKPSVVPVADSVEEQEDLETEMSLSESSEAAYECSNEPVQEDLEAEMPLSEVSTVDSVEEREDLDTEKLPVVHVAASIEAQNDLEAEKPRVIPMPASIKEQDELEAEMPTPAMPMVDSVEEQEDRDIEQPMPVVPVLESIEEQEDLDVVPIPERIEGQEHRDIEKPLPKPPSVVPDGVKEPKDPYIVKLLLRLSGDRRAPISLRNLGVLFIVLVLLISLGIGASFLSRAQIHPAAYSATPASHATSPASTPTFAPVASNYPTLAGTYTGTIYDLQVNATTSMSLTGIKQNQGSFSGFLKLGPNMKSSGLFSGTIDTTKHLQFTLTDATGSVTLFFEGAMQSATSLSGDYYQCSPGSTQGGKCSRNPGGYGIWNVVQA